MLVAYVWNRQEGGISFAQGDNVFRMNDWEQLMPAPHAARTAAEGFPVDHAASRCQVIPGQQW